MPLPCYVQLLEESREDNGKTAWATIAMDVTVRGRMIRSKIMVEGYSGDQMVIINQDPFGMDPKTGNLLLLEIFRISSGTMFDIPSDTGEAFFDLENLLKDMMHLLGGSAIAQRLSQNGTLHS